MDQDAMTTNPASTIRVITAISLANRTGLERGDPHATDRNCRDTTNACS